MTIAEELDRRSGRPHKSATITDAMKYAFGIEKTPDTIGAAVKAADFNPPDEFKVTWMNGETKLKEDTVEYGKAPEYTGDAPTKTGYTFLGWNSNSAATEPLAELPVVTGNATYYAIFEINTFTIAWKNGEATLETDENVEYGTTPTYDGETPTKAEHTFIGWNTDADAATALETIPAATEDATYFAIFEANAPADDNTQPEG